MRACAADVERAECREVAQVECLQDGVADIGEVKPHDARGTVDVLRVVDDEVGVEGELHLRPLVGCEDRALVWRARGIAIAEEVTLGGGNLDLAVVRAELVAEVTAEAVLAVGAADILTVEEGEAVLDGVATVCVSAALQRIEVVVGHRARRGLDTLDERRDILVDAVLVVDALAPVAHLLLVEDLEDVFERHVGADGLGDLTQLLRAGAHQVPEDAVMASEGIAADAVIKRLMGDGVVIL